MTTTRDQTVQQWNTTIQTLDQQISVLEDRDRSLTDAILRESRTLNSLRGQRNALPEGSAERAQLNQTIQDQNNKISALQAEQSQVSAQIVNLDANLQSAERNRDQAQAAGSSVQANAPPAQITPLPENEPPNVTPVPLPDVPALGSQTGPSLTNPVPLAPGEEPVLVQRQVDVTAGENILTVNAQAAPDPYGDALAAGAGEQAFFAAAVDPTQDDFQQELANLRQAQENENIRFRADNLPVPDDFEDTFDQNPPVFDVGEIGDEDPEVAGLLEQQQAIARADVADAYREPEPVPEEFTGYGGATQDEAQALNQALAQANNNAGSAQGAVSAGQQRNLREQFTNQQRVNASSQGDWRVRIRLAPGAQYLYKGENPGILKPLVASDGVIFPYTPTVQTQYQAKYESYQLTHSNYRGYFYQGSQVGDITITGLFTAQDTAEAEYLLAVIHFFRTVTKMFYGQGQFRGSPPPLVQLSGFGEMQFNNHNCLVSTFNYTLPKDVDYIQIKPNNQGLNLSGRENKVSSSPLSTIASVITRLKNAGLPKGANPNFTGDLGVVTSQVNGIGQTTYVPTKIELSVVLHPLQTRQQVSQQFSLQNFANGNLLKGGFW